ncbi:MAG: general secretion pathway protein B [Oceanicoccus sp.]|jgi:general secretion pathway protein B
MSYLLKALQKAEQERQHNVQVEPGESVVLVQKSSLPKSLIVIVVLILLMTLWQVWPAKVENSLDDSLVDVSHEPNVSRTIAPVKADAVDTLDVVDEEKLVVTETKNVIAVKPKDLSELTSQELAMIPSLNLASHIYSSAADFRSVVINDQTYKEGALIRAGLILEEINQSGIVINIHGQRVELPKGISWVASQNAK